LAQSKVINESQNVIILKAKGIKMESFSNQSDRSIDAPSSILAPPSVLELTQIVAETF